MTRTKETAPRRVRPRTWATLSIAGAALGAAVTGTAAAAPPVAPQGGEQLWRVQAEGGEAGEGGMVAEAAPELAYLGRLALVEGHIRGAVLLYDAGLRDEAVGLAGHPEAEMMDEVRADLAARGKADFSATLDAVGVAMAEGADTAAVAAALDRLTVAIAAAGEVPDITSRLRADLIVALTRAAAQEYEGSIKDGAVDDLFAYVEAQGFIAVARDQAAMLAADAAAADVAARIDAALAATGSVFGGLETGRPLAGDPGVIFSAAATAELAAYRLK